MKHIIIYIVGGCLMAASPSAFAQQGHEHSNCQEDSIDAMHEAILSEVTVQGISGTQRLRDARAGYHELLTFNEDKTYTGYDNYFTYDFNAMTYGWYMQMGSMLTLQSNGFGYNRRYNWLV